MGCGRGGQSMIEPAAYGVPVCFGPEIWNFQDTADRLRETGGANIVRSAEELRQTLTQWLDDRPLRTAIGDAARGFILGQIGAVERTFAALARLLPPRAGQPSSTAPHRIPVGRPAEAVARGRAPSGAQPLDRQTAAAINPVPNCDGADGT
jgi:hypothetical protein